MDQGREQALERLIDTVQHRQHALVEGESGVGKTCVQRALSVVVLDEAHLMPDST